MGVESQPPAIEQGSNPAMSLASALAGAADAIRVEASIEADRVEAQALANGAQRLESLAKQCHQALGVELPEGFFVAPDDVQRVELGSIRNLDDKLRLFATRVDGVGLATDVDPGSTTRLARVYLIQTCTQCGLEVPVELHRGMSGGVASPEVWGRAATITDHAPAAGCTEPF